jgi:hypothetical protein
MTVANLTVAKLPAMPPADGKYISLRGKEIHYAEQTGRGRPVVMIHGCRAHARISIQSSRNCRACTSCRLIGQASAGRRAAPCRTKNKST